MIEWSKGGLIMNKWILIIAIACVQAATSFANANLVNVEALNQKLKKENATWVAKDNWLNQMPKSEAKHLMGLQRRISPDVQFVDHNSFVKTKALPSSIDWRNKDGKNWVSPILNQANCGSCVAFASIGTLETQMKISSAFPDFNVRLSTQNLFSCGGGSCDYGWYPDSAASSLMNRGVPDEACMPYQSGSTGKDVACKASCADTSRRSVKIASYGSPTLTVQNVESVKEALQHGPLVTTLSVYADFMSYAGGVYKHSTGDYLGGHAVSIVGYDDATQSFIIRNSWGEDWGVKGFANVSYDDASGVGDETWGYTMPSAAGSVSVQTPRDYSYFSEHAPVKAFATFPSTDSVTETIFDAKGAAIWTGTCPQAQCENNVDVTAFPEGRYEVQAQAMDAHGASIGSSTRQFFYVVHQAPTATLTMKGHGGLDLGKDLKDRVEFDVTSTLSGTVPLSGMEFHFRGPDGVDNVRHSEVVPRDMTVGWRTNLMPNGAYEIWMKGVLKTDTLNLSVESAHYKVNTKN